MNTHTHKYIHGMSVADSNKHLSRFVVSAPDLHAFPGMLGTTGHFYRRPLSGVEVRFSQQPVGGNKSMSTKAGLQGNP